MGDVVYLCLGGSSMRAAQVLSYSMPELGEDSPIHTRSVSAFFAPHVVIAEAYIHKVLQCSVPPHCSSHWEDFHPSTNVMWLSYLLRKIRGRTSLANNSDIRTWQEQFRPLLREVTRCSSARDTFVKLFATDS